MQSSFVLRVESLADPAARLLADSLDRLLAQRGAPARVESGTRSIPGTTVSVGVRDNEGRPQWLAPLRVGEDAHRASGDVMSFLERWGFIARANAAMRVP